MEPTQKNLRSINLKIISSFATGYDFENVCGRIRNWAQNFPLSGVDELVSCKEFAAARYYRDHEPQPAV